MEQELMYRPYAVSVELSRTSKGLYSWTIKTRADPDGRLVERTAADCEATERAMAIDKELREQFEVKDDSTDK